MKKKIFTTSLYKPLLIGIIASILYLIDAFIGNLLIQNKSFMWVSFAIWTIFFGVTIKERIKGLIGIIIGFCSAVIMMLITKSFTLNIFVISISTLLGVFLVNCAVMFFEKTEKIWLNSITGIFTGIFLTFSGLGCELNPANNTSEFFLTLTILVIYTIIGLACGFSSTYFINKTNESTNK